jgi:CheY-like chemotaxis protein
VCKPRKEEGRPNFWLRIGLSDGRISASSCSDTGSAERNSRHRSLIAGWVVNYSEADELEPTTNERIVERPGSGETVLVVDDELSVRMLVVEVLEELGHLTIEARDGPTALRLLQSVPSVDLLITDLALPGGIDGRELADRARTLKSGIRVLFITGYAENAAIGSGQLEPGAQLLHKPFSIQVLASRIKNILSVC